MKKKIFNHADYPDHSGKYEVTTDGEVRRIDYCRKLTIHRGVNKQSWVRLSGNNINLSMTLAKLMLLTFRPKGYKKGLIAVHVDGNPNNNSISNLVWGTRKMQSQIAMKKLENFKRVSEMGKKYGPLFQDTNFIKDGRYLKIWLKKNNKKVYSKDCIKRIKRLYSDGMNPSDIARYLKISRTSIYNHINKSKKNE